MTQSDLKIQKGELKDMVLLFFFISLITFSNCLFLFVEKLLLASFSTEAMEAAVNAAYVCQIFQAPCVALVLMAQVFVGRYRGSQDLTAIGPAIWQFIWFSILSMIITVPLSLLYGEFYFASTSVEKIVFPYFYFLVSINFLYPLGAALSCFYVGQGKTRLVLFATLGSQIVKLILAYLLIFGWENWIPAWGLLGGALSTAIAQGCFCLLLLTIFLKGKNSSIFNTNGWRFQPKLFWSCVQPGLLRASNRILSFTSWAAIAHLMSAKGGDYILILSIGGTLFIFLPFIGDALCQAVTTTVAQILGSGRNDYLKKAFISGTFLSLIMIGLLCIPLILFPIEIFHHLFPKVDLNEKIIRHIFGGVWLSFAFYTWGFVPISYILAFKDMNFSFFVGAFNWINGFLLMYIAIQLWGIESYNFWTVLSIMHATTALLYLYRTHQLIKQNSQSKKLEPQFS